MSAPQDEAPQDEAPQATTGGPAAAVATGTADGGGHGGGENDVKDDGGKGGGLAPPVWLAVVFLLPALLLLGFLVVYPIVYSVIRSFFDADGAFTGADNYVGIFQGEARLTAVRNTLVWIVVAPTVVTILGLVFAVLTERIRWATVFKLVVFMPMAISLLASGVIFRLVYEQDPDKGVANAAMVALHDTFAGGGASYPGAAPRQGQGVPVRSEGGAVVGAAPVEPGRTALLPLLRVRPEQLPEKPTPAAQPPAAGPRAITGTVWFDFTRGGGGAPNAVDATESGLPGVKVEAVRDGEVAGSATTGDDGTFRITGLSAGQYTLRIPADTFTAAYGGAEWLGGTLITPAIIGSYLWVWAGFAMVLIAAGLAAIPRDALEAARVDGATEWQVFRRVTIPLLAPVLTVVLLTLVINVMKVFDLVFVIGGGDPKASVLALEMWTESFGGGQNQGAGSAIAVLLFVLVLPAMYINIRRLRQERK
ncbi:ABC transporter permease subunit [Actinomadura flavalba]|uniref:ABC transporter permease subunit n=1 Tax=Actinomadura flavalba TaxID=1120938 RepID=UPI00037BA512|nr:ABC transporter permease subunit [Actinomadura flavalba]